MNGRSLLLRFLVLPMVLGSLLIVSDLSGIYVARRSTAALHRFDDLAFEPVFEIDEVISSLNQIEIALLKLNQAKQSQEFRTQLIKMIQDHLKKVRLATQQELSKGSYQIYSRYISIWIKEWDAFEQSLKQDLISEKTLLGSAQSHTLALSKLLDKMYSINTLFQANAKDQLEESETFSKKASIALILVLILGAGIGIVSSVLITRELQRLFQLIQDGKANIETLLNNLDQGFFVFNSKGEIEPGVSRGAMVVLGGDPTGQNLRDVLPLKEKEKGELVSWLDVLFSANLSFASLKPLGPNFFEKDDKYIELDFRPIFKDLSQTQGIEVLDKVICIASDKTEEQRLKRKSEAETALVKVVMAILADRESFLNFVQDTRALLVVLKDEIRKTGPRIELLLRGFHSLKSGAAAFALTNIVQEAQRHESVLTEVRFDGDGQLRTWTPEIEAGLVLISNYFDQFLEAHKEIIGKVYESDEKMRSVSVGAIQQYYNKILSGEGGNLESPLVEAYLDTFIREDIALLFRRFKPIVEGIAERQGKKVEFSIEFGKTSLVPDPYVPLVNAFIHAFRNAVDHGIEDQETRIRNQKSPVGHIQVTFSQVQRDHQPLLKIQLKDDGKGIDAERVRKKALERGIFNATEVAALTTEELYQLLFRNGFSTRDIVTDLSGRGVGLDVVAHEAMQLGGRAWIESKKGVGTCLSVEVPWKNLPVMPCNSKGLS